MLVLACLRKLTFHTSTSRILDESGAALAPPPRQAGTGVLLPPVAPRIVSTRVHRPDPGDVPQVVDKGKGRDFTNLGSSDAEDEAEEKEDDEDFGEEKKSGDEGLEDVDDDEEKEKMLSDEEKEKTSSDEKDSEADDDKKSDNSSEHGMDLDPNITPRNPAASKRQASASPIAHRHVAQRSKADHANDTPLAAPVFAGFDDTPSSPIADDSDDLQGASRTMGGFARGKGHGVAPNMADFSKFLILILSSATNLPLRYPAGRPCPRSQ